MLSDTPRATVAIWAAAGLVAAFGLFQLIGSKGDGGAGAGSAVRIERGPGATQPATTAGPRGSPVYVHVAGAVRAPGLLRLPTGSRVARAVEQAGGPSRRADLSGVNLAAKVEDGQQIVVPTRGATAQSTATPSSGTPSAGTPGAPKPSLGTATEAQLDEIDGIGPTLAQRIIEYRTEHGGFSSIEELRDVEGIGEKRYEALRKALQP